MTAGEGSKNFFISYSGADSTWAEWIAWVLEEAGYTVVLQAWDFRPGSNFVLEMQQAAAQRSVRSPSSRRTSSHPGSLPRNGQLHSREIPPARAGSCCRCGCASANPRACCRRSSTSTSSNWKTRTPRAIGPSPPASRRFLVPPRHRAGARSLRNHASLALCRRSGTCRVATPTSREGKS